MSASHRHRPAPRIREIEHGYDPPLPLSAHRHAGRRDVRACRVFVRAQRQAARDAAAGSLRRRRTADPDRGRAGHHAAIRGRREAGARMVEAVSVGRVECACRRRLAQQPDARRHRQEPGCRARTVARADRQFDAADHRRGRSGDPQSRVDDSRLRAQHDAVRRLRRATGGALYDRSVRRLAPRRRGACVARECAGVSAGRGAARAGCQHRDGGYHERRAACADRYDRKARDARQRSGARHAAALCAGRGLACRSVERATKRGEPVGKLAGFAAAVVDHASCAGGAARPDAGRRARRSRARPVAVAPAGAGGGAVGTAARAARYSGRRRRVEGRRGRCRRRDGTNVP
ncbi:hypothetical protein bAD24_I00005 [Burkholderia sp. AD24]|nr:hypothetical protein bAD24_I00005 [Burkholderia sp. AD24]